MSLYACRHPYIYIYIYIFWCSILNVCVCVHKACVHVFMLWHARSTSLQELRAQKHVHVSHAKRSVHFNFFLYHVACSTPRKKHAQDSHSQHALKVLVRDINMRKAHNQNSFKQSVQHIQHCNYLASPPKVSHNSVPRRMARAVLQHSFCALILFPPAQE
jgi:hypothetical protein